MTMCTRHDGRRIKDCTRGLQGCLCAREILDIAERIAYPQRGTEDETRTLQDFAEEIQQDNPISAFTG